MRRSNKFRKRRDRFFKKKLKKQVLKYKQKKLKESQLKKKEEISFYKYIEENIKTKKVKKQKKPKKVIKDKESSDWLSYLNKNLVSKKTKLKLPKKENVFKTLENLHKKVIELKNVEKELSKKYNQDIKTKFDNVKKLNTYYINLKNLKSNKNAHVEHNATKNQINNRIKELKEYIQHSMNILKKDSFLFSNEFNKEYNKQKEKRLIKINLTDIFGIELESETDEILREHGQKLSQDDWWKPKSQEEKRQWYVRDYWIKKRSKTKW